MSDLDEASPVILEFSDSIDCIVNSVYGIVEDNSSSVVSLRISFSGIIQEANVIRYCNQNIVDGSMSGFGFASEDVGGLKNSISGLKDTVGILDFISSIENF